MHSVHCFKHVANATGSERSLPTALALINGEKLTGTRRINTRVFTKQPEKNSLGIFLFF